MNKKFYIPVLCLILCSISIYAANDDYKPYLHKASVPEHPKLELYGQYKTNLFPGAATYAYNIEVPKGTNGLTPSLSISYNSQIVNQRPGILGAGWLLTQNYMYRDVNSTLNDTSDDIFKLVLNNVQYELVYFPSDGLYRTKIESYMIIEKLSDTDEYWQVTSKDGTLFRFGYNSDSELTSNSGYDYATKWSLDLVEDLHGNKIYYSYLEDPFINDSGTVYLSDISYNTNGERQVSFVYEDFDRPDERLVYDNGNRLLESRRLKDINVIANGEIVRRYNLDYASLNQENSLTSLSSVKAYGSDNSTLFHDISFEYFSDKPGYTLKNYSYESPEIFSDHLHNDFGVRATDVNNDGFVDIVKARTTGSDKKTYINDKEGNWTEVSWFVSPEYIVDVKDKDCGFRFVDLNSDGFTDILYSNDSTQKAYLNNGTGWNYNSLWDPPLHFVQEEKDKAVRLVDFNGDGRVDLIKAHTGNTSAFLNNGSGWSDVSDIWKSPINIIHDENYNGVRFIDINGDGLQDIIKNADSVPGAWLNNGSGWTDYPDYYPPTTFVKSLEGEKGIRFTDVNGDGLPDLIVDYENDTSTNKSAYINNGNGWTLNSDWQSDTPFTKDGFNIGRRLGDLNGDGTADILVSHTYVQGSDETFTYLKNSSTSYLLKRIVNEYGGIVEIDYSASTSYNNSALGNSTLGFNIWIVANVSHNNSLSDDLGSLGNYSYSYFGGKHDYSLGEFMGFNIVNETRPDGSMVSHYFHQDDALKGKEYRTEVYNSSFFFSKSENSYSDTDGINYEVFLDHSANYLYDTNPTAEVTNVSYAYDSYGNVVLKNNYGDVSSSGDERYESYSYVYNTSIGIVDKVGRYSLYEDDNLTLAKETLYYYDGLDYGAVPVKGELTKVSEWNSDGEDSITSFEYDSYGNVVKKTDPLGHSTKYTYGLRDLTFTYADRVTNALRHRTDYEYDLGTGNLLWEEKNNIRKNYAYDVFGRITKEVMPYDSFEMPTKEYNYSFDGSSPEVIKVSLREHGSDTVDTYYYYDGFANLVQLKTSIEDDKAVTKNIFYDGLGRVESEQNPYKESFSPAISTPSSTIDKTYYTYDALDRVTKVINPDGTEKEIDFNKYTITDYDENDNKHEYKLDAHGRIINVIEYNINPNANNTEEIYNTSYEYDTNDNLIKITDNEGNEFKFTYDSLGRKIKLDDPDLGVWTYAYDAAGNLMEQNDSVGNVITMSYDALNRVLNKNSTDVNISFSYDTQYYGTLRSITMGDVIFRYTYDKRMRVTNEEVYLNGSWIETGVSYDSMDRIVEKRLPSTDLEYYYNKQGKVSNISDFISSAHYNAFGSISNRTYDNNLVTKFSYTASNNRLTNIQTTSLQNLAYTYDDVGNIMSINDSVADRVYRMGYDGLDRLINTTINREVYRYEYDSIGNIKKIVRGDSAKRLLYEGGIPHAPSNVMDIDSGAGVYSIKSINESTKDRTIEFYLINEKNFSLTAVNWSVDFGDGNVVNSPSPVDISGGIVRVIAENSYGAGGDYTVNVTSDHDWSLSEDKFGVKVKSLELINNDKTECAIKLVIGNDLDVTANNVNWECDTGNKSSSVLTIAGNSNETVFIDYNYSSVGDKILVCNVSSSEGADNKTIDFELKGLKIQNFTLTDLGMATQGVEFNIYNHYYPLDVTWVIDSDGQTFTNSVSLGTNESSLVSQDITYTTDGDKRVNVTAYSGSIRDTEEYDFETNAFDIDRYTRLDYNTTRKIISFIITNQWPQNLSTSWNITDPSLKNTTSLMQNDTLMVLLETNYTTEGKKEPSVNVYSSGLLTTLNDWFNIYIVEMLDLQVLKEGIGSTISEITARSDTGNNTISWQLDTGYENLTSSQTISINETDRLLIFVEHNYSSSGIYKTNASVNTSSNQDHASGVVVT